MSVMEDLISFDVIEGQKENIQSLPQGRSAKALAAQFGPTPFSPVPTPGATRTLNDAIRQEYETELQGIADADDPLDIYDRYVKWTMNAYPSAQATTESQLRPLLERATKTFQGSAQYKNDVRYLKLWLNYIRFFSDAPRETYAYLSRHAIGDNLALYYEEFAAWLESSGRWTQAEEVYKLGMDKEARPTERLMRKYGEFQKRFEARPQNANEPTSPALPTVRPALAAKLDPFAAASPRDPQASQGVSGGSKPKTGRTKMAIFSDADGTASRPSSGDTSKGWDSIGTIAERKKENVMEAKPWVGETMKAGKKSSGPKMMVFKDQNEMKFTNSTKRPIYISTSKGKKERWFADIVNVSPNEDDPTDEYCFEELRARSRGWLDHSWSPPRKAQKLSGEARRSKEDTSSYVSAREISESTQTLSLGEDTTMPDVTLGMGEKKSRPRKKKILEKSETQTIKAVLDSPSKKTKVKRRKSVAEPTMTLHTKAATDDVLDIFNQPLRNIGPIGSNIESDGDTTDYDADDYTCGVSSNGDSTRTGGLSETESEYNDDVTEENTGTIADSTQPESVSPWSDFSTRRHVPDVDHKQIPEESTTQTSLAASVDLNAAPEYEEGEIITPVEEDQAEGPYTRYLPDLPEGIEAPTLPFRTAEQAAQSRLPFMTPIVEMTESSLGLPTIRANKQYLNSKTPSKRKGDATEQAIDVISSPLHVSETPLDPAVDKITHVSPSSPTSEVTLPVLPKEPVVKDSQCNPHNELLRNSILDVADLKNFPTYHDSRPMEFKHGPELRRYIKSLAKTAKPAEKTAQIPPVLHFPGEPEVGYCIRRELGKGAYAPVYLASTGPINSADGASAFMAVKSEEPPSPWEYYVLSVLHSRLALSSSRAVNSMTRPQAFHHFSDEVYLMESYHDQGTLLDLVNLVRSEPSLTASTTSASMPPGLDESVAMFFAVELLRTVECMHDAGILHGDLKADNCLVRLDPASDSAWASHYNASGDNGWSEKGMVLIDFGRGVDMTAFRPDVGFIADWKTSKDDCVEMRELRPWTYQVDYWGAAGVLHVLLFGKWIEDIVDPRGDASRAEDEEAASAEDKTMLVGRAGVKRRKLKEGLKRYWQTELWNSVFDALMNPTVWAEKEPSGQMPIRTRLAAVRGSLEAWLEENAEKKGLKMQLRRLEERIREKRRRE